MTPPDRSNLAGAVGSVGAWALGRLAALRYLVAVTLAVLWVGARPATWRRTVRDALGRQILFGGIAAVPLTCGVALLVGLSVVVQAQVWLRRFGQNALIGPLLTAVVVRELGPLLTNIVVIGRSGNAMAAELGSMAMRGEVRVLDAQGLDPFVYLVVPRVISMMACALFLDVLFIVVALAGGYVFGSLLNVSGAGAQQFLDSVTRAVSPADVLSVAVKSLVPGLLSGVICCTAGLAVGQSITDLTEAVSRAVQHSVIALFLVSTAVSALTYL